MCIAVLVGKDKKLTESEIRRMANANRDGGGFAYIKNGKTVIEKGFITPEAFIVRYSKVVEEGGNANPMLVHFRIATTGKVGRDNCHPFVVGRGPTGSGAVIHNGSFYTGDSNAEKSDTRVIAERHRNNFTYEVVVEALKDLEATVTSYNKMVFLFDDARYVIVNEKQGQWYDGIWYSNNWFKPDHMLPGSGGNNWGTRSNGASCRVDI